ncbi:MAG: TIGR02186 family protein [Hyphomicrobium sp.]
MIDEIHSKFLINVLLCLWGVMRSGAFCLFVLLCGAIIFQNPLYAQSGPELRERIEADLSTRTIAITSGYSGAEVLIFGAIENGKQPTAESGFYDIVVVVEGLSSSLTLRKKSRFAGLWVNTQSFKFNAVPTFYALASTRPIEEFIDTKKREELGLGFNTVSMSASFPKEHVTSAEFVDYKDAVVRLKQAQGLFSRDDKGVFFTGRSLFRSTIRLPATVPVGTLNARLYLFHEGVLLSSFMSKVMLEREGIERWIYAFAFERPFSYGILTVLIAILCGLVASALFHRRLT